MPAPIAQLELGRDGAELAPKALDSSTLAALEQVLAGQARDVAGVRLFGVEGLLSFLATNGPIGSLAARSLGEMARPVRAILLDKTASANWSLAWHQDRVVAVRERKEVEGFGPWTRKQGVLHVEPPFELLAGMLTLRVHLDPVPQTNAPLLIAPGSHRFGRIPEADVPQVVSKCGVTMCLAESGDVWTYATPILHASDRASAARHRRVLQVDYAVGDLPGGLQWLGV
ncbi:phytanoyl-CoA dioxygenase family protein [Brevundimonas sp.]|uniref:phytanoyl-CoA dioxygenase family protein n=1 Tax=Brevundimonas sp. TaxID=1871086 RepID=UPI002C578A5E|nr:phytanoyl-CoA dioxygenase family protein [Brevundimonas sp.]HWQ85378.1 phytanoyl-CoA dioxygenase family protein [Brevundimonas sp.]